MDSVTRPYAPPRILSSRESSSWQLAYEPLRQPSSAAWPTHPVPADCPRCRGRVVTLVTREAGMGTWTAAGGLALAGCVLGCCLLPFAWDTCKDATHTCPECGCELGKRACAVLGRRPALPHHHHHHHQNHHHLNVGDIAAAVAWGAGGGGGGFADGWGAVGTGLMSLMRRHAS
ncbi:hypothetical protein CHLRE_04g220825v5 [Chlamydomonas reinhardtii]|uniref:LITAF domain-containing protein n=1 Tax=Chlamydomonas reinhardtii TaxID=3055 RepID=A0A2K3DU86_CHLRE|nr:uncharacterized protein CHLRE_04g220825v5 [Chlamydomonas reinhardtii]PNW84100.1 hypothetical protein CHLRE_04g220825v5 [Chlamydomonas reinhardtii]